MKNKNFAIWSIVLLLLPFVALIMPLPFRKELDSQSVRWGMFISFAAFGAAIILLRLILAKTSQSLVGNRAFWLLLITTLTLSFGCLALKWNVPPLLSMLILIAALMNWCVYMTQRSRIGAEGIATLLLTLATISSGELLFRKIPNNFYLEDVAVTPPLTKFFDKGNAVFRKNGFRGARTCKDCPDNQVRIFTMGGSSVYGIPMYYSLSAYASVLQRILNERRPGENYEVLNAGVPGYGIVQVLDSINQEILKYKPDIITFGEWFNETAPAPGWYGIAGKSDMQGYITVKVLLWLQNFRPYMLIHRSKLFSITRFYLLVLRDEVMRLLGTTKAKPRPRMTPDEYRAALHKFVKLADANNFMPVFILEPLNRTEDLENSLKRNEYQRAMFEVARESDVPLIDPLTPLSQMKGAWLFYDTIHSNQLTHRTIAETIYDSLFYSKNPTSRMIDFAMKHSINLNLPRATRSHLAQFERDVLVGKTLEIKARTPHLKNDSALLRVTANERELASIDGLSEQLSTFKVKLGSFDGERPIVDLKLSAKLSAQDEDKWLKIGNTGHSSPVYISAQSDAGSGGAKTRIFVREQRFDPKSRGYNVVVVGAKSGEVKASAGFDLFGNPKMASSFVEFMHSLNKFSEDGSPPIVALAVSHDGAVNISPEIAAVLRTIGASGNLPPALQAFVVIGVLGANPGSALELSGGLEQKAEIGSKELLAADLIEVQSIKIID